MPRQPSIDADGLNTSSLEEMDQRAALMKQQIDRMNADVEAPPARINMSGNSSANITPDLAPQTYVPGKRPKNNALF